MLTKETKQKIKSARDILVGQLPLPSDQVELITITLIYKFMNDMDEEFKVISDEPQFFKGKLKKFAWKEIISDKKTPTEKLKLFAEGIKEIQTAEHIQQLFKDIFSNTFLKFQDGATFNRFIGKINEFEYSHSEELGNAFEFLLQTMGAQGKNGQFRTPRNIIDFIVEAVNPDKTDTILDPACGTAGFLISAYKHIQRKYTKGYEDYRLTYNNREIKDEDKINWGDKLKPKDRELLGKNIHGYDITPMMARLARVNLYLHEFKNPIIHEYDTISPPAAKWNDKYDCILANPLFMTPKEGIEAHEKFKIQAKKAEVLFSDYILEHLNLDGKAGFIVPEGVIFQNNEDYVQLRQWMVEEAGIYAVVSLPAGVFQPYSGVKTSILFIDRALARKTEHIILIKADNDGFSLNTNRTPISQNDLPIVLKVLEKYKEFIDDSSLRLTSTTLSTSRSGNGLSDIERSRNVHYKDPDEQIKKEILKNKSLTTEHTENTERVRVFLEKNVRILDRIDLARLDAYKSHTASYSFCKKEFVKIQKLKVEYVEAVVRLRSPTELKEKELTRKNTKGTEQKLFSDADKKILELEQKWKEQLNQFFTMLGIKELTTKGTKNTKDLFQDESELKQWFESELKEKAIAYGTLSFVAHKDSYLEVSDKYPLPKAIKKVLDDAREFNLGFDRNNKADNDELRESSYELVELGEVCEFEYGKPLKEEDRITGEYPVFGSNGIVGYHNTFLVEKPFIIVGRKGSAGSVHYSELSGYPIDTTFFVKLKKEDKVNLKYLYNILKSLDLKNVNTQAGVPGLNRNDAYKLQIPLPPLSIQEEIVREIEGYQNEIKEHEKKIEELKDKIKSSIDKVWNGG